jgi:hypothetical protein
MKILLSENRKSADIDRKSAVIDRKLVDMDRTDIHRNNKHELKPIRREREREGIRYHNVIIPNYLYNEYPIHRQFVIEKEIINQNDYSNFFIIIIIILIVSSILIYTKI